MGNKSMKTKEFRELKRRLISLVLAVTMVFTNVPVSAFAEGTGSETTPETQVDASAGVQMGIKNTAEDTDASDNSEEDTWTLTFLNRDNEVHTTVKVEKGQVTFRFLNDMYCGWLLYGLRHTQ